MRKLIAWPMCGYFDGSGAMRVVTLPRFASGSGGSSFLAARLFSFFSACSFSNSGLMRWSSCCC